MSHIRYTHYVKTLRLVLPVIALTALLSLLLWPWLQERRQLAIKKPDIIPAVATSSVAPLQVTKPEYQGIDRSGHPYHITAARVEQALDPKAPLLLIAPQAMLGMDKNLSQDTTAALNKDTAATLQASQGLYDMQAQTIDLKGQVILQYAGYEIRSNDLAIDILGGAATTTTPITGTGPRATLSGQMLSITDKGGIIVLKGPSRIVFRPSVESTAP